MLHGDGKVPWRHYKDIPNECLYNMDELATDTMKHKQKVIGDKNRTRTFIITPEGDGKMNHHVTVCLTSCADGMLWLIVVWCGLLLVLPCELLHVGFSLTVLLK